MLASPSFHYLLEMFPHLVAESLWIRQAAAFSNPEMSLKTDFDSNAE